MDHEAVEEYVLSMPHAVREYPFGEEVAVYKVDGKMFALLSETQLPARLSLKCAPELSEALREKYESVMPGVHLNKNHWYALVLTGQLSWEEVHGLIRHSYQLVTA